MSQASAGPNPDAALAGRGVIIVRRGEFQVFQVLRENFEAPMVWDRRIAERRVEPQPVAREHRMTERRAPLPGSWTAHGFVLAPSESVVP